MKIHLLSDLHLEFGPYNKPLPDADVLILAGDILVVDRLKSSKSDAASLNMRKNVVNFFDRVSEKYENILYVMGNHEFYHSDFFEAKEYLSEWLLINYPKIYLLKENSARIKGVYFFGSTLWSDFNQSNETSMNICGRAINDYRLITFNKTPITPTFILHEFSSSLAAIKEFLEANENKYGPVVAITHMAPSPKSIHPQYAEYFHINGAYHSDLEYLMKGNLKLWVHGHMHNSFDYKINNTRVIDNPRGYYNTYDENPDHNPNLILEI